MKLYLFFFVCFFISHCMFAGDKKNAGSAAEGGGVKIPVMLYERAFSSDGRIMVLAPNVFSAVQAVKEVEDFQERFFELVRIVDDRGGPLKIRITQKFDADCWLLEFSCRGGRVFLTSKGYADENSKVLAEGIIVSVLNEQWRKKGEIHAGEFHIPVWLIKGFVVLVTEDFSVVREANRRQVFIENRIVNNYNSGDQIRKILRNQQDEQASRDFSIRAACFLQYLLAEENGWESLTGFFLMVREGTEVETAFQEAFGMPAAEVEEDMLKGAGQHKGGKAFSPEGFFLTPDETKKELRGIVGYFTGRGKPEGVNKDGLWALYSARKNEQILHLIAEKKVALLNLKVRAAPEYRVLIDLYVDGLNMASRRRWTSFKKKLRKAEKRWKKDYDEEIANDFIDE